MRASRSVGQSGHCRRWEEPKREPALSRAASFPGSGGRSLAVVAYPPLERPNSASRTEGSGGQTGVSAPSQRLPLHAGFRSVFAAKGGGRDADVDAAYCDVFLFRHLKSEALLGG